MVETTEPRHEPYEADAPGGRSTETYCAACSEPWPCTATLRSTASASRDSEPETCGWDTRRGDGPIGGPCALAPYHEGPHSTYRCPNCWAAAHAGTCPDELRPEPSRDSEVREALRPLVHEISVQHALGDASETRQAIERLWSAILDTHSSEAAPTPTNRTTIPPDLDALSESVSLSNIGFGQKVELQWLIKHALSGSLDPERLAQAMKGDEK